MKSYLIFSIICFVLLIGSLGTNIYTQYQLSTAKAQYTKDLDSLQAQYTRQKNAKNSIRDIWENQAASNDKLVVAQDIVDQKTAAYLAEVKKSIRFINTVPQLLPGANEASLKAAEKDLSDAQANLEDIISQNTDLKVNNKNKIDAIYLDLNEDQNNRANPDR